jgi:hypothetical protein
MISNSTINKKEVAPKEVYKYNNGALFEYMFLTTKEKVFLRCCETKSLHEIDVHEFIKDFKLVTKKDD